MAIPAGYSLFQEDLEHIACNIADIHTLKNASLFLTGGTGFFGKWLLEGLLWATERHGLNLRLTLLSRDPQKFLNTHPHYTRHSNLSFVKGDLSQGVDMANITSRFTHCIHAATLTGNHTDPALPYNHLQADINGANLIIDIARRDKAQVLVVSSGGVYTMPFTAARCAGENPQHFDNQIHGGLREEISDSSTFAEWNLFYGLGKRTMEALTVAAGQKYGFDVKIARPFAFIGPWLELDRNFAAGNFIRDALQGNPITIMSDGSAIRSYLYPSDMVIWLLTILLRGRNGVPYNVGSKEAISIAELAHLIAKVAGLTEEAVQILGKPNFGAANTYLPNTERAEQELGLKQRISLQDAIARTMVWVKKNNHSHSKP